MAESLEDKTEQPTPRRREKAREEGRIARSNDLTTAVLLLGCLVLLSLFGGGLVQAMRSVISRLLSADALGDLSLESLGPTAQQSLAGVAIAAAPLLLGLVAIAVAVNLAQVGFFFSPKRLQPNFGALNPLRGLAKLFSRQGLVTLLTSVAKMGMVGLVAWSAIDGRLGQIVTTQQLSFLQAFAVGADIVYAIALRVGVLLLILAIIDYIYQKRRLEHELKMTKQEVKDEMRSMDGDPKIKARRRQVALQLMQQRMKRDVPTADVVVTNPTEIAVALKYDSAAMHAPKVVAKGRGYLAQRIRQIAIEAGVPIIERKPLAQALYKLVDVGGEIPEQFYAAVAEILAYVYELTGKLRRQPQPVPA
jgi:flagellar biosynthetic protein FlhB